MALWSDIVCGASGYGAGTIYWQLDLGLIVLEVYQGDEGHRWSAWVPGMGELRRLSMDVRYGSRVEAQKASEEWAKGKLEEGLRRLR